MSKPLLPGESTSALVDVYGLAGTIGATFTIHFGSSLDYYRKEVHHIPIFVIKGLEIRSFEVQICNFGANELPSAFCMQDDAKIQKQPLSLLMFQVANCAKTTFSVKASLECGGTDILLREDVIVSPNATRLFAFPIPRFWIPDSELEDVPKPAGFQYFTI